MSIRCEDARGAVHVVGPALRHHVERDAGGRDRGIVPSGDGLDLLEGVEVIVSRRRISGADIGDVDPVQVPGALSRSRALGHEDRLLSALVAPNVDPVDLDARDRLHDVPRVAGQLELVELVAGDDRPGADLARVEKRRLARYGDGRFNLREFHTDLDVGIDAGIDGDFLAIDRGKVVQFEFEAVQVTRGEVDKAEVSARVGHEGLRCAAAGQRDRHAGQRAPVLGNDSPVDISALGLPESEPRQSQETDAQDGSQPKLIPPH